MTFEEEPKVPILARDREEEMGQRGRDGRETPEGGICGTDGVNVPVPSVVEGPVGRGVYDPPPPPPDEPPPVFPLGGRIAGGGAATEKEMM